MIPAAEHIAQASKIDNMVVREIDLSLRVDDGWVTAGRFRVVEESDDEITQGFWACYAHEDETEWIMNLALCPSHRVMLSSLEELGVTDSRVLDSIKFLVYGSTDDDIIAKTHEGWDAKHPPKEEE